VRKIINRTVPASLYAILLILFIAGKSFGDNKIYQNFIKDYNDNTWKIVVVERGKIKYGDPISGKTIPLFGNRDYNFNTPAETVDCPSLCFNNSKLLIAKNNYSDNTGKLILIDLDTGTEKLLTVSKPIVSAIISRDDNYIAYLSDYNNLLYSLYILDLKSGKIETIVDNNIKHIGVYDTAISWGNKNQLFYSDKDRNINVFDIKTKAIKHIASGYNPIISPDNNKIIYRKRGNKPFTPSVYELTSGKSKKISGLETFNAIWSPNSKYYLIVKNISKIWRWNEWEKSVIIVDVKTMEKHTIFEFEGYEYIDCK
jgi:Tol biopolymer transport system component